MSDKTRFHVELIKPSHYDDGYVVQWVKAWIPSNSLASMFAQTRRAAEDAILGDDVEVLVDAYDETNTIVPVDKIIRRIGAADGHGVVLMVGVQSNQFPRAMDMARRFRAAGIPVALGGFHVSGCHQCTGPQVPLPLA